MKDSALLGREFADSFETEEKQEEQRLRDYLYRHPEDFEVWLDLIKQVEKFKSLDRNKSVYIEFLQEFRLYHPIWKKLAECYSKESNSEMVICTYEEALKFLPVNVDLWLSYCTWKMEHSSTEETRAIFETAISSCGKVYTSFLLWDKFLDFEKTQKNYAAMEQIFWKILNQPLNKLYEYFTRFKNFVDQFGKELPSLANAEDYDIQKKKVIENIMSAYEKAVIENNKRKIFETGIKQSYFTHKPLDEEQVMNWRKYLEFEESEGDHNRIILLYDRCIVPTCYIAEFWIRYARYLEKTAGENTARELYCKANTNFLFRKPDLFVHQGYFEEVHGKVEEARRLYKHAYETICKNYVAPGLVEAIYKHINLERKTGNHTEVVRLYELAIDVAKQNKDSYTIAFISCHYARFLQHHLKDLEKALDVYESAVDVASGHNFLYNLYIIALWSLSDPVLRLQRIQKVYEAAVAERNSLIEEERLELWLSYINFIRNHWSDRVETCEIEDRFRKSFHHSNSFQLRFRQSTRIKLSRQATPFSYENPLKKMKLDNE